MTHRRAILLLFVLVCPWALRGRAQAPGVDLKPTVILVSLDGWRWDYAQKYSAPTLTRLTMRGVSGPLIPSYPTKTFPNHYTIVTGLYPGITASSGTRSRTRQRADASRCRTGKRSRTRCGGEESHSG